MKKLFVLALLLVSFARCTTPEEDIKEIARLQNEREKYDADAARQRDAFERQVLLERARQMGR